MRSPPAPSAPLIGDTHIPLRLLHSSRAFSRGHPYVAPAPPPCPRLRQRIPIRFCRRLPPHPRLRRQATHTLLPASPPRPRLRRQDTHTLLPATPTLPAPSTLLPRPLPAGGVRARAYIRRAAVSGVEPVGSPYPALSHLSPGTGPWGYRHGGRGRRGGGTSSPSPVSNAPRTPNISPTLSGFLVDGYPRNSPAAPTPPAPSQGYHALLPAPHPARAFASRLPIRFCRRPPPRLSRRRCRGRGCGQPPGMIPAPDGWSGRVPRPSHRSKSRGR